MVQPLRWRPCSHSKSSTMPENGAEGQAVGVGAFTTLTGRSRPGRDWTVHPALRARHRRRYTSSIQGRTSTVTQATAPSALWERLQRSPGWRVKVEVFTNTGISRTGGTRGLARWWTACGACPEVVLAASGNVHKTTAYGLARRSKWDAVASQECERDRAVKRSARRQNVA
jgi:hypothetical protein